MDFESRVMERTGVAFSTIPWGSPSDLIGGTIMVREGDVAVVAHGYPDREEDGVAIWDPRPDNFRRIDGLRGDPVVPRDWFASGSAGDAQHATACQAVLDPEDATTAEDYRPTEERAAYAHGAMPR